MTRSVKVRFNDTATPRTVSIGWLDDESSMVTFSGTEVPRQSATVGTRLLQHDEGDPAAPSSGNIKVVVLDAVAGDMGASDLTTPLEHWFSEPSEARDLLVGLTRAQKVRHDGQAFRFRDLPTSWR